MAPNRETHRITANIAGYERVDWERTFASAAYSVKIAMSVYNSEQRKQYDRDYVRRAGSPGRGPQHMPAASAESFVEQRLFDLGLPVYIPKFDGSPDDMLCRADGRFWTVQVKLGELNTKTNNLRCTRMNEIVSELLAVVWPPGRLIKWVARNIATFPKIFFDRFGPIQMSSPWPVLFDRDLGCSSAFN